MKGDLYPHIEIHDKCDAEMEKLRKERDKARGLIDAAGKHWLSLNIDHPIKWEGAIDEAMRAACAEIATLREHLRRMVDLYYAGGHDPQTKPGAYAKAARIAALERGK